MDCRCPKLSHFFCKFLSAVGVLEQVCRYIFCNFGAMSLVAKTPWKTSQISRVPSAFTGCLKLALARLRPLHMSPVTEMARLAG